LVRTAETIFETLEKGVEIVVGAPEILEEFAVDIDVVVLGIQKGIVVYIFVVVLGIQLVTQVEMSGFLDVPSVWLL
jgi:hypothetical protein